MQILNVEKMEFDFENWERLAGKEFEWIFAQFKDFDV